MCFTVLQELNIFLLITQVFLIISKGECAPKLGGIHIEQLLVETFIDEENNTNYKREYTVQVPTFLTNIKNTTSLYVKLTGNSLPGPALLRSKHKNKNKEVKILEKTDSTISNHTDFNTKSIPTTRFMSKKSPLNTVKLNNRFNLSNPETPNDGKTAKHKQTVKLNEDVTKSTPKDSKIYLSSVPLKIRRDGARLQTNGYAFNEDNCQLRGDRVVCGYNNEGLMVTEPEPTEKDCIIRGDRVECGYLNRIASNNNRRNIKAGRTMETISETINKTDNLTIDATISSHTNATTGTTHELSLTDTTKMRTSPTSNVEDNYDFSRPDTQELFNGNEHSIASIITNTKNSITSLTSITDINVSTSITGTPNPTIIIKEEPKLSGSNILKLLERVEKILAIADTTSNPITTSNIPISHESSQKEKRSEAPNLVAFAYQSPLPLANTATVTNLVINSTMPATTTSNVITTNAAIMNITTTDPPTTTTPVPYIDDEEFCIEKDGRIVCYDNMQDYYDGYLEK